MKRAGFRGLAGGAYLLVMAAVVLGLVRARQWATSTLADQTAHAQWNSFRDDVARQADERAPVRRRVPQSAEPPGLVLMRDYFGVCLVIAIVLTSALFATTAFFVGGVVLSREMSPADREDAGP
jgi:hypothetical protein